MADNPKLGGYIQMVAAAAGQLGEKAWGTLNSELQTKAGWMLDPTMEEVLSGPSDFRIDEIGIDNWPVTLFVVPPRGQKEHYYWMQTLFELAGLVFVEATSAGCPRARLARRSRCRPEFHHSR